MVILKWSARTRSQFLILCMKEKIKVQYYTILLVSLLSVWIQMNINNILVMN